jgi:hypothetical protein
MARHFLAPTAISLLASTTLRGIPEVPWPFMATCGILETLLGPLPAGELAAGNNQQPYSHCHSVFQDPLGQLVHRHVFICLASTGKNRCCPGSVVVPLFVRCFFIDSDPDPLIGVAAGYLQRFPFTPGRCHANWLHSLATGIQAAGQACLDHSYWVGGPHNGSPSKRHLWRSPGLAATPASNRPRRIRFPGNGNPARKLRLTPSGSQQSRSEPLHLPFTPLQPRLLLAPPTSPAVRIPAKPGRCYPRQERSHCRVEQKSAEHPL